MKFTENTGLVLEMCKVMNLTVWKFITSMAGVLSSQLLPQMQVELEDYMQACIVRAPFLADLKSGTVDDVTARVSVMGAVTAEWRVNRRVRQLTAKLQREIMKRQVEEQHVPNCSAAWIYQDFPALLSEAKAESFSISVLCDLILTRYDLTKDKEFRDLLHYTQSYLQRQNDQLNQKKQNVSQTNQYPTHRPSNKSTETVSKTNNYPSHVPTIQKTQNISKTNQYPRHMTTNQRTQNASQTYHYPTHRPTNQSTQTVSKTSGNSYTRPVAKTTGYSRVCHEPREQEEVPQFGHHHYTTTATAGSSDSRQSVRPHIQANKQTYNTQGRLPKPYKRVEPKPKTSQKKKNFVQKLDDYLSKVCPDTKQPGPTVTESKSPEFTSSHMGGLVIKIVKKPKSVQVSKPKQPKKELTIKERNKQAFLEHVERIQAKLRANMKADANTGRNFGKCKVQAPKKSYRIPKVPKREKPAATGSATMAQLDNPRKRKTTDSSSCSNKQSKCARLDTGSNTYAKKDNSRKRKATNSSSCSSKQSKCARLDTGSFTNGKKDNSRKRKAINSSLCSSIHSKCVRLDTSSVTNAKINTSRKQNAPSSSLYSSIHNKCARLETGSTMNAQKDNPLKRKAPNSSLCSSIQNKCARLDIGSAMKALKRHVDKRN